MNLFHYRLLIGLCIAVSLCTFYANWAIGSDDPALYASIAKHITRNNDWLFLYVNGTDWLDKPHLPFWCAALCFKLFGISAAAYQLPSLLTGLLGLYYIHRFVRPYYGEKVAYTALLISLTALHFIIATFDVRAEIYLATFTFAAIYHYQRATQTPDYKHWLWGAFFAACAVMTKGIFTLLPIFSGFIGTALLHKQYKCSYKWIISLLFLLLFITPELYALYAQFDLHPEKQVFGKQGVSGLRFFFWDSQFGRFFNTGPIQGKGDFFFFFHTFLWAFLPWSFCTLVAGYQLLRKKAALLRQNRPLLPLTISALLTFLLFSLSRFQLPHYILILFPIYAIITAVYLHQLSPKALKRTLLFQSGMSLILCLFLMAIILLSQFPYWTLCLAGVLLCTLLPFIIWRGHWFKTLLGRSVSMGILFYLFLFFYFYPGLKAYDAGWQAAEWLQQRHTQNPAIIYKGYDNGFNFHVPGTTQSIANPELLPQNQAFLVLSEAALNELKTHYRVTICAAFPNYRITKLTLPFLNHSTRPKVLSYYYLVQIYPLIPSKDTV